MSSVQLENGDRPAFHATSWSAIFPWLTAFGGPSWDRPIDRPGTPDRASRLSDVADLAVARLQHWPLGQIFPTLPGDVDVALLNLPKRAHNAMIRQGATTTGDLTDLDLRDLLDWHNVGLGTVHDILTTLGDRACSAPIISGALDSPDEPPGPGRHRRPIVDEDLPIDWVEAFVGHLRTVARWRASLGTTDAPLLPGLEDAEAPDAVTDALAAMGSLTPSDVLGPADKDLDLATQFDDALSAIGERGLRILSRRLFADSPATLESLGQELGVTRERVRQIESKVRARAAALIDEPGRVHDVAMAVRTIVDRLVPLGTLLERVPALTRAIESVGQPAWRVLDRLDDAYEIEDGWCAAPTLEAARTDTRTILEDAANAYGVVDLDDVVIADLEPAALRSWLAYLGVPVEDSHAFLQTASVGDRAAALLSVAGEPMSADDLVARMSVDRDARSLRNRLAEDERFIRADKGLWALAEWGMDEYRPIRRLIQDYLDTHDGQARLRDVITEITVHYSVSANSVAIYASAAPFETRNGVVRVASTPRVARKRPEDTAHIYRGAHSWLYRVTLTKDHLRGSGSLAPVAIATITGLIPGQELQLTTSQGPQAIRWTGPQPGFGTVRRLVMEQDLAAGTEVFFVIGDGGSFAIRPLSDPADTSTLARARRLVALPEEPGTDREVLARAVGLDADATLIDLLRAYRERGDTDVADLLARATDDVSA